MVVVLARVCWTDSSAGANRTPFQSSCGAGREAEEAKRGQRERLHVLAPVALTGRDHPSSIDPSGHRERDVASRVAVAITGGAGRAGLPDSPGRAKAVSDCPGEKRRVSSGGRAV